MELFKRPRLAEYFFRTGLPKDVDLNACKLPPRNIDDVTIKVDDEANPLSFRYEADTLYRYPAKDYSEQEKFPPYTPMVFVNLLVLFS